MIPALHSAALHPSSRRSSPFTVPPLTSAIYSAAHPSFRCSAPLTHSPFTPGLHSAALHPSFRRSAPFTPPPLPSALHYATLHPSPRRLSLPPFTPAPFPPALHSRPSLRRTSLPPIIPRHGQPHVVELQLVQLSVNGYPGSSLHRAAVAIREAANPPTQVEQLPATFSLLKRTPTNSFLFRYVYSTLIKLLLGQLQMQQPLPSVTSSSNGTPE
jgi:hypothetical protein